MKKTIKVEDRLVEIMEDGSIVESLSLSELAIKAGYDVELEPLENEEYTRLNEETKRMVKYITLDDFYKIDELLSKAEEILRNTKFDDECCLVNSLRSYIRIKRER